MDYPISATISQLSNWYDVNFCLKIDVQTNFFDQVTSFMSKIMSLGGDAEAKKSKKSNLFTTFEILRFAQNDKVSTIPIQQFTLHICIEKGQLGNFPKSFFLVASPLK